MAAGQNFCGSLLDLSTAGADDVAADDSARLQQQQSRVGTFAGVPRHPGSGVSPFKQQAPPPSRRSFGSLSTQLRRSESGGDAASQGPSLGALLSVGCDADVRRYTGEPQYEHMHYRNNSI